jgi:hypothetical protein
LDLEVRLLAPWYDIDDAASLRRAYETARAGSALRAVLEDLREKLEFVSRPASDSRFPA